MKNLYFRLFVMGFFWVALFACNKDSEITERIDNVYPPTIELESESGIYVAKVGCAITISPTYGYVGGATYTWKCNGSTLSKDAVFVYTFDEIGSYYVTLYVETANGSAQEELRIDVQALAPPVISLATPSEGVYVKASCSYLFAPDVQNGDTATFEWTLNGEVVGTEISYTFCQEALGTYTLALFVENEDGYTTKEVTVYVVERLPMSVVVPTSSFFSSDFTKYVELGRTLYVRPLVTADGEVSYQWCVDGVVVEGATDLLFAFTPTAVGSYTLTFTATEAEVLSAEARRITRNISATGTGSVAVDIPVVCVEGVTQRHYTTSCQLTQNKVYEFIPAPGQFVNETSLAGYNGEATHSAAIAYAESRLAANSYVSLGAWGGYIVVGFDHSIANEGGYAFSIMGNQFEGSSEPGIVWVMQDTNGNGLPDDEWYELKGSAYGAETTYQDYACTYYRPGAQMDTPWQDNYGNSDCIDHLSAFHTQDYYYPLWVEADSYTLYGTRLESRTVCINNIWYNQSFDWGYADNFGSDMSGSNDEADACKTYFNIAHAVNLDGSDANLDFIDFIKVQTGVQAKSGITGENSTEVFGFTDETNH